MTSRRYALRTLAGLLASACQAQRKEIKKPRTAAKSPERKDKMRTVVNSLSAEISVTPRAAKLEQLRVTVTMGNAGSTPLRFNAQYFTAPALMLKFEDAHGNLVPTGGPPMPGIDDGKVGRIQLAPGETVSHVYEGELIFGNPIPPGKYKVRFVYWNGNKFPGEWAGSLETPRGEFELTVDK
ncbi:MAG: hypothetical protein U0Q16_24480 [Bryobacteraceae bacterium]